MPIVKRPPKDELVKLVGKIPDKEIAALYGIKRRSTVLEWRRYYDLRPDGSYWPQVQCENPHCRQFVSEFLRDGLCVACSTFRRRNGRNRTKKDMYVSDGGKGWCKRCKEAPAICNNLCIACDAYKRKNGRSRPAHLIKRDKCKNPNCGRPWKAKNWIKGRCQACYLYLKREGTERPAKLCKRQAEAWCDCGQPATHLGVELPVFTGEGNETIEKYNLCNDCWQLEQEPMYR